MRRIIITILILAWWSGTLYFISQEQSQKKFSADDIPVVAIGDIEGESYSSIYFKGEKIGYSATIKQKAADGLMWHETSYLRLPVGGVLQEVLAELIVITNNNMAVDNFTFSFSSDEYESLVNGKVNKKGNLEIKISTPESSTERTIAIQGPLYMPSAITHIAANDSFQKELYRLPVFDPMTMTMRDYKAKVARKTTSPKGDENVWLLYARYNEYNTKMWVDSVGNVVMEESPSGFISYKEPREKALEFDLSSSGSFDLLTEFSVLLRNSTGGKIESPKIMKARLEGFDPTIFELNDFNQAFDGESCILTVVQDGFPMDVSPKPDSSKGYTNVVSVPGIDGYFLPPAISPEDTMATPLVQKNDLRILRQAQKITKGKDTEIEKLEAINRWLYDNIKKDYRSSIPSALDIMRKMVGDCNEHTTLFTALSRSLGIPTRINIGLVYLRGAFFYHAWPQCYVDGKWHAFEPTYGERRADATHIKLLHGSINKQIEIMRIQNPYIEILETNGEYPLDSARVIQVKDDELRSYPCFTENISIAENYNNADSSEAIERTDK
ncbi:MAG: transglutaminase-like domain-containing protein [Candidatus Zixiibacteriota bacterium]